MPYNKLAQNVFGTIGTICWSAQVIPQIWKTWRVKSTKGLSETLLLIWGISTVPLGAYAILQNINIPLIVQPQLFSALCFISWAQCQHYGHGRPLRTCILAYVALLMVTGGLEAALVFAIKPMHDRGNETPVVVIGVFSSVLLAMGLLPQYYQIWKHKEVTGLSLPFMFTDMMGGVFNDLSLVFKEKFDVLASVSYSIIVVMDGAVVLAALILNPIAERRRRAAISMPAAEAEEPDVTNDIHEQARAEQEAADRDAETMYTEEKTGDTERVYSVEKANSPL